jgi:hypothetical protein
VLNRIGSRLSGWCWPNRHRIAADAERARIDLERRLAAIEISPSPVRLNNRRARAALG